MFGELGRKRLVSGMTVVALGVMINRYRLRSGAIEHHAANLRDVHHWRAMNAETTYAERLQIPLSTCNAVLIDVEDTP